MRVYAYELKKLLQTPAIVGFVLLSLIVNAVIVFASYNDYLFAEPPADVSVLTDHFDDYDAAAIIGGKYVGRYALTGEYAENVLDQYVRLQPVIDNYGANDAGLSPYFGQNTRYLHRLLFRTLFGAILAETGLLALFLALLGAGYESIRNTESVVYASRIGRKIQRMKLAAALTASAGLFVLIAAMTFALFFTRFDWSAVWSSNVSSLFNTSVTEYWKPFITRQSFDVLSYLWACTGVAAGITICSCLLGFAAGLFLRSAYASCIAAVVLCGLMFIVEPLAPVGGYIRNALNLTPVQLWVNVGDWFTDGYADILVSNFEYWGVIASLVLLSGLCAVADDLFRRKDLA
jgi:hypothetical protein